MKASCNKILCSVFFLMFAGHSYSLNKNPASVGYIDHDIDNLRQQTTLTAGPGINITNNVISQTPNYAIGDVVHGGVVFWLDDTTRHGLIVAKNNVTGSGVAAVCNVGTCPNTITTATGIGVGLSNTRVIISMQLASNQPSTAPFNFAPMLALRYTDHSSHISDWFLPSLQELLELYAQVTLVNQTLTNIGGRIIDLTQSYWSSSADGNVQNVWAVNFSNGSPVSTNQATRLGLLAVTQF